MTAAAKPPSSVPDGVLVQAPANNPLRASAPDMQSFQKSTLTAPRWLRIVGTLGIMTVVLAVFCLQFGTHFIGMGEILRIGMHAVLGETERAGEDSTMATILMQVRLPRVLLGFLVGCSLASVGVALQALLRNPLADPYVLGVSSGAALGVSVAVLLGVGTTILAMSVLPLCGFLGSLLALLVVYRMAATYDRLPIHSVLLAGVILNAIFSALIMFITSIMEPNRSFGMMAWLMGSLTAPTSSMLTVLSVYLVVCLGWMVKQGRVFNVLALGEEPARALGIDTERAKRLIFLVSALMTGAVVSVSGMIGFIGMVIPHAVRLVVGADHRLLMPASALVGGSFLLVADTFARTFFAPSELPVGIMTALVGGPFFVYLLVWKKDQMS